jgi:hypothetical protein
MRRFGKEQRRLLEALKVKGPMRLVEIKRLGFRKRVLMSLNLEGAVRLKHVDGKIFMEASR